MPPTKSATITAKADASPWPATVDTLISRRWGEQGWQFPEFGRPAGKEVVVCTVDEVRRAGINDLIEPRYPDFATRTAAVADLVASVSSTLVTSRQADQLRIRQADSRAAIPGATFSQCDGARGIGPRVGRTALGATTMSALTGLALQDRIDNYVRVTRFPRSLFISEDGRVVGTWIMGNDYRVKSGYYGGYPAGYLKRVRSLFPDKRRILHILSGKVDIAALPGDTVDINAALNPTYCDNAQTLERVPLEQYDLALADPPYSIEDADRYQTTMVKRNCVMRALQRLPVGAHVVWLDQVLPMYRKDMFAIDGVIGIVKSTNHRFRVMTIFRRREVGEVP